MKRFFVLFIIFMTVLSASAQRNWQGTTGKIGLYTATDKVGIGIFPGFSDKLTVKSISGETPLGLIGYSTQINPFIKLSTSSGVTLWKIFAQSGWWAIGDVYDSTRAAISFKPVKSWARINATVKATGFIDSGGSIPNTTSVKTLINDSLKSAALLRTGSYLYFGADANGSWRVSISADSLIFEMKVTGAWVKKGKFNK